MHYADFKNFLKENEKKFEEICFDQTSYLVLTKLKHLAINRKIIFFK